MSNVRQIMPAPAGQYAVFAKMDGTLYTRPVVCLAVVGDEYDKTDRWVEPFVADAYGEIFSPTDNAEFVAIRWPNDGYTPEQEASDIKRAIEAVMEEEAEIRRVIQHRAEQKKVEEENRQRQEAVFAKLREQAEQDRKDRLERGITTPALRQLLDTQQ